MIRFLSLLIVFLFGLVGAHVPRAFSLIYLILALSAVMAFRLDSRAPHRLPMGQFRLFRVIQLSVLLFSLTYPLAMLHFGFWQLSGRQTYDVFNAFFLPNALFLWGFYMARRHFRLMVACLLGYGLGGLIFLLLALHTTLGWDWFSQRFDSGSLVLPWGNTLSMNVRSIEQNGIFGIVMMPVVLSAYIQRRYWLAAFFCMSALAGYLSVLPLANGRLWIISLVLAAWPCLCWVFHLFGLYSRPARSVPAILLLLSSVGVLLSRSPSPITSYFCDERFGMYQQAIVNWTSLIRGGRLLNFRSQLCDGHSQVFVSLMGQRGADVLSLHSVPLDIIATVGLLSAIPLLLVLLAALVRFLVFALFWTQSGSLEADTDGLYVLWAFISVLIPQWFFQPLHYGDGLLYYISYAVLAALLAIRYDTLLCRQTEPSSSTPSMSME